MYKLLAALICVLIAVSSTSAGIFDPGGFARLESATDLPTSPYTGQVIVITDDSATGACDSNAGSSTTLCYYNGTSWTSLGSGSLTEADTLNTVFNRGKTIDGANSLANAFRVGSTRQLCIYDDATLGLQVRPCTDSDVGTLIPTNFNWYLYDEEGAKAVVTADPDSIGAGSGTVTMATSEQFVASNLGIELNESDTNPTCSSNNYNIYSDTSEATIKICNNGVTAALSPEKGPRIVRKTGDETVDGVVLQNDDHLLFAVDASSFYTFTVFIKYSSSTTADFQYTFTVPAGATGFRHSLTQASTASACTGTTPQQLTATITTTASGIGGAGTGTTCAFIITGQVLTAGTAGNLQFQWAQTNDDGATVATVYTDSYLIWQKL